MTNNILKFPVKVKENLEESTVIDELDIFLDDSVEHFIISVINNFEVSEDFIDNSNQDEKQKMFAFLRETFKSTYLMMNNEKHLIQEMADSLISFDKEDADRIVNIEI